MQVFTFSEDNFADALSNRYTDPGVIKNKKHFNYFNSYLGPDGLAARTIVVESEYVSKDYLHDYASYYAFCFENYPKFCKRIHFFSSEFNLEQLQQALLDPSEKNVFWDSYLGFIVVKPIPVTIVGYTVLNVYKNGPGHHLRRFWGLRDYKVHFFGKDLKVSSLAFQEQDSVLAACATTAIWSMLNKASIDFHTILKVPSEITKDADILSNDGSRLFPNKGLDGLQICQAINNSGLAPEVRTGMEPTNDPLGVVENCIPNDYLKKIINAYEHIGIPIILGIKVPVENEFGYHAITVSGHKIHDDAYVSQSRFISDRIEKIYVHDDQFGPFAWARFLDNEIGLESPWTSVNENNWPTYVVHIIIPLYPKIRISYENIEVIVAALDGILLRAFQQDLASPLMWDIKLNYSEDFKKAIIKSNLENGEKLRILGKSMPKYIWVVTCYYGEAKFIEFTFDATDVSNGMLGETIICYFDTEVKNHLNLYIQQHVDELATLFQGVGGRNYLNHMLREIN